MKNLNKIINLVMILEGEIVTSHLLERLFCFCEKSGLRYKKFLVKEVKSKDFCVDNLPLFVRSADPLNLPYVDLLIKNRKPYLYYLDDNFWAIEGDTPLARYYSNNAIQNSLDRIVSNAEIVIVNSEILADVVKKKNSNTVTLNAFFDFSLIENIYPESHEEIRIGFAGSITRDKDFSVVTPAVKKIIQKYGDRVVFEFAGLLPSGLSQGNSVRFFPPNDDYSAFVRWQCSRGWDIALAPMLPDESNMSKTNNKFREYGACRIAGIYSNYGPYPASVKHGNNGLLVDWTEDAWFESMDYLVGNEQTRKKLGEAAYQDVLKHYSLESVANSWIEVISSIETRRLSRHKQYFGFLAIKSLNFFSSLKLRIQIHYENGGISNVIKKTFFKIFNIKR